MVSMGCQVAQRCAMTTTNDDQCKAAAEGAEAWRPSVHTELLRLGEQRACEAAAAASCYTVKLIVATDPARSRAWSPGSQRMPPMPGCWRRPSRGGQHPAGGTVTLRVPLHKVATGVGSEMTQRWLRCACHVVQKCAPRHRHRVFAAGERLGSTASKLLPLPPFYVSFVLRHDGQHPPTGR